ncbi:MAG: hypothetical protein ACLP00_04480 [Terracidiphilus sp.]
MLSAIRRIVVSLAVGLVLVASSSLSYAQEAGSGPVMAASGELPEAPEPQFTAAAADPPKTQISEAQTTSGQNQSAQQPAAGSQGSSSSQTPAARTDAEKSDHEKAEEQLKEQEKQRVMGVMATFNTTRNKDALPLSSGQKFQLFFKSVSDPWPFVLSGAVAGIGQAENSTPEWGQGAQGYAKRFGAGYSDYFIGNFFGNAVLPSLWHEDPRYFQKGTGSVSGRILWAASSTVWCKRDKGGWGPNWANVVGNLIGSAIGRAYYPPSSRTVGGTISDGLTVSVEGVVGSELIEFWPDMVRSYRRKHAEKLARQAAQRDAQSGAHPAPQSAPAAKPQN